MNEQLAFAEELLASGPKTDLILFSEAALTGYVSTRGSFDLTRFAEPLDGVASSAYAHLARRFDALVVGPVIERDGARRFNSLVALTPEGERLFHYRKRHPWMPETWATPGDVPFPLVTWRGVALTCAICFDVHFLAEDAARELSEAELLLFSSAWVDDGEDSRPGHFAALRARFPRLQLLNANWGVGRPRLPGQGGSLFVDSHGEVVRLGDGPARLDVVSA
jgi:predicted amidohydrolase